MKKIELLAPAKDLTKAKIAIMYGADAVYVGGKSYSLRSRASNFSLEELEELCRFRELYCKAFLERNLSELAAFNRYLDFFALVS